MRILTRDEESNHIFTVGSDWRGGFSYSYNWYCRNRTGVEQIPSGDEICKRCYCLGAFNPNGEHVREFVERHELSFGEDDYEKFLNKIDAVYIASPHETHYEYAKSALKHGKHVLCEKPMVFKRAQAEELFELARAQKCVLMEAIKTAYCPGFNQLITVAQSGVIGEIRDVEASFSRITSPALREMADARYGGAFTEFGSYTLLPILKLLGREYRDIRFDSILNSNGIDGYTKASFIFDGRLAEKK